MREFAFAHREESWLSFQHLIFKIEYFQISEYQPRVHLFYCTGYLLYAAP